MNQNQSSIEKRLSKNAKTIKGIARGTVDPTSVDINILVREIESNLRMLKFLVSVNKPTTPSGIMWFD